MKLKKILIGISVLCAVAALIAFYILANYGWKWRLPESLLNRFDFTQLPEKGEQLSEDGFTDLSYRLTDEPTYCCFARADNDAAMPMIYVYWEKDRSGKTESNEIKYDAETMFMMNSNLGEGNKDHYRFRQEITIRFNGAQIWMIYYTKHLFNGRQQVIDYLEQFCNHYCTP